MDHHDLKLNANRIPIKYFISAPMFLLMLFAFFYYCYLSVRECRRSRSRESTPLLRRLSEEQMQVY